jgi:hypothetical protein
MANFGEVQDMTTEQSSPRAESSVKEATRKYENTDAGYHGKLREHECTDASK